MNLRKIDITYPPTYSGNYTATETIYAINNGNYYLIIDRNDNVIELVNINDIGDTFYFELEKKYCPFEYYRVMSKEEYNISFQRTIFRWHSDVVGRIRSGENI